ncbi:SPFH/Band 7/PHB domain-containing membrane-associated protein family, putative [Theobroma cacao]|uniref:SPFH/Band 7/PHB domain-containing membrane-associated protein family, putative n=1 Tax=Theobroma cacao TaxID=3641 RepID=A0A061DRT5_THECC|nr:SPFH/Band 7/PHB domain-containing membrane-associated protein family, putative [Theobroma cacao]
MKNNLILLLILYRLNMIRGKRLSYPSLSIAHTSYHFTLFHQMIAVRFLMVFSVLYSLLFSLLRPQCAVSLGMITLDKTFADRDELNEKIVRAIDEAAEKWGPKCLKYEIWDISPPSGVERAMKMQAEAERKKRAQILELEGERQANINMADGTKSSVILAFEAARMDQINRADGEAEAILAKANATAKGIQIVSQAIQESGGIEIVSLRVADKYIDAFRKLA